MIKTEIVTINNHDFEHIWSDENKYICRNGQSWEEVYNPLNTGREYTEGDYIVKDENDIKSEVQQILDILLGEDND